MNPAVVDVADRKRLNDAREVQVPWMEWGPYLSERQWGTVREDDSDNGDAWNDFTHGQACALAPTSEARTGSADRATTSIDLAQA